MVHASFDQLAEIVDAVGDKIDVIMDSGVQRGAHVLKALTWGKGRWRRAFLFVCFCRRTGGRRESVDSNEAGNRARYAFDGGQIDSRVI